MSQADQPEHPLREPGAKHPAKMPLPKEAYEGQPAHVADAIMWLHAYMLKESKTLAELKADVGYDAGTISKVFSGKYPGSMDMFAKAVAAFRRVLDTREDVGQIPFAETRLSRKVWTGLDFGISNAGMVEVIAESRMGKTRSTEEWIKARGYEGRAFIIKVPPRQSPNAVLMLVAEKVGVSARHYGTHLYEAVSKCLNSSRLIIVDQAHRMIPRDKDGIPYGMEHLIDLHDDTGCGVVVLTTSRWKDISDGKRQYMYEQWNGRVDLTINLPVAFNETEVRALVEAYFPRMSAKLSRDVLEVCNARGHLGTLRRIVNLARRIANKAQTSLEEAHFYSAIQALRQLGGES